jgi:hypothetical protein
MRVGQNGNGANLAGMVMDPEKSNSLADLAARIRIGHEAARQSFKLGVQSAMATGDMLLEAKELLDHGQWMPWLKEHCDLPQRRANLYMRLAKNRKVIEAVGTSLLMCHSTPRYDC